MTLRTLLLIGVTAAFADSASAFPKLKKPAGPPPRIPEVTPLIAPASVFVALDNRLARTKLTRAVYVPNLCVYRYPVGTRSEECQKFLDQALGYYYSYVWMEAARSAETALAHDPNCAYAWLILHKGMEKWGQGDNVAALKRAQELMPKAPHREQLLITARLHEKGLMGTGRRMRRRRKPRRRSTNFFPFTTTMRKPGSHGRRCPGAHSADRLKACLSTRRS